MSGPFFTKVVPQEGAEFELSFGWQDHDTFILSARWDNYATDFVLSPDTRRQLVEFLTGRRPAA